MSRLIVVKYGGNAMVPGADADPILDDIAALVASGDRVVLVHGGGPQIDAEIALRGIVTERIAGLRVTDARTLAVTESVLCGTVNKAIVRELAARSVRAVGISGEDGALLVSEPFVPAGGGSLGFVGAIVAVETRVLVALLDAGFTPVVAPLGVARDGSTAYNVNADTSAGAIAGALRADAYVNVTNVPRVRVRLDDPTSELPAVDATAARAYLADGSFDGGMRPKMESALDALARGASSAIVCGSGLGALRAALAGEGGTIVRT